MRYWRVRGGRQKSGRGGRRRGMSIRGVTGLCSCRGMGRVLGVWVTLYGVSGQRWPKVEEEGDSGLRRGRGSLTARRGRCSGDYALGPVSFQFSFCGAAYEAELET